MSAQPLVLMMAGGTGGHVYPALAVAQELIERGFRVEWMGTERGLEARVVPAAGIKLHCLSVRGVRGKDLAQTQRNFLPRAGSAAGPLAGAAPVTALCGGYGGLCRGSGWGGSLAAAQAAAHS